ncbi:3-deoxy-D-manno-octulosonic acid transferase [Roseovarius gaetbuli]|uniref:3-deoxy-D-manno-octulosonic acid transferase n=1 Tax=Roseovarius gaetbuli TaxID=1356575 RepID=A0A1X6YB97_9RHOB|nr:3-deoxy-D-manno-octulosonic acid transferase [Roseovarius gaetbuli]SLN16013.1 3-deoxy-D-manno-octulosonic acid transferase [Roseovarius gaetbuli]
MTRAPAPLPLRLYSAAANLVAPLAYARVKDKLAAQGTDPARLPERMGRATARRPDGPLIWFHAASVGESVSVLRLITHMGEAYPGWSFLITSGTATSAQVVASRLPPRTTHQFAPLDARRAIDRFLAHWRPTAAIFVESELWPQMLARSHAAGIPMALINARISDGSARNWKRAPKTARHLLGVFAHIHTQDARTTAHLQDLGLHHAKTGQNLKSLSGALPFDPAEKDRMTRLISGRAVWLASSTHPGEDDLMLAAHKTVLQQAPDALLILVPRHPERGLALETLIATSGLSGARRAIGGQITGQTQVYLADTLGETGLWYALCPLTCLCGSFTPVGGHNPYEPAYAGSAILHGPLYKNFADTYPLIDASGAALEVADATELAQALITQLTDPAALEAVRSRARAFAAAQENVLDQITTDLISALDLEGVQ